MVASPGNKTRLPVIAGLVGALLSAFLTALPAQAADGCGPLTQPVYATENPAIKTTLLTPWQAEYDKSKVKYGYTTDIGEVGYASLAARDGLVPVTRMYNRTTADFYYAAGDADIATAEAAGFAAEHVTFYAATSASECTTPAYRYTNGRDYKMAVSDEARDALKASGWQELGVAFHLGKLTTTTKPAVPRTNDGGTFSIAVIPDTQTETDRAGDPRFANRMSWLVDNKDRLDLRYVLHTGDVTNWGWLAPRQFDVATAGAAQLKAAGIPYAFAPGNHDVAVVGHDGIAGSRGYGGSAYVNNPECVERLSVAECKSWLLVRKTEVWNQRFPLSGMGNVGGAFEEGKSDNYFTTFEAGGAKWLVLSLELFARPEAIAWAGEVVKGHPDYNVLVQTHAFETGEGIDQSKGGYGSTTGQYLWDNLLAAYPNIKMVFSGHQGYAAAQRYTGNNGNTVISYLGNVGRQDINPVRILTIDTANGRVKTHWQVPNTGEDMSAYDTDDAITITITR